MRAWSQENRPYGSEGGARFYPCSYPYRGIRPMPSVWLRTADLWPSSLAPRGVGKGIGGKGIPESVFVDWICWQRLSALSQLLSTKGRARMSNFRATPTAWQEISEGQARQAGAALVTRAQAEAAPHPGRQERGHAIPV